MQLHDGRLHAAAILAPSLESVSTRNATLIEQMVPAGGSAQFATATTFMTRVLNDQIARAAADADGLRVPLLAGDESDESTCERGADVWFSGTSTRRGRDVADCLESIA